jgi:hypothetical protein
MKFTTVLLLFITNTIGVSAQVLALQKAEFCYEAALCYHKNDGTSPSYNKFSRNITGV